MSISALRRDLSIGQVTKEREGEMRERERGTRVEIEIEIEAETDRDIDRDWSVPHLHDGHHRLNPAAHQDGRANDPTLNTWMSDE